MAKPGGLQLLPETRRHVEIKGQKKRGSIFLGVFLIILVTAGYIAADFYLTSLNDELAGLNNQVLDIDKRRDKETEREIATLNSQLALIGSLLNNHVFWTGGFDILESSTVPQLRFISLNADATKEEISAKVRTVNHSELAKQVAAYFAEDSIESVDVSGISLLSNGQVEASLLIKFNKSKFLHNL